MTPVCGATATSGKSGPYRFRCEPHWLGAQKRSEKTAVQRNGAVWTPLDGGCTKLHLHFFLFLWSVTSIWVVGLVTSGNMFLHVERWIPEF